MKPISASLALHGAEWAGQKFFQMQIIGMIQREILRIRNRLPRFLIRIHSVPVQFQTLQSAASFAFEEPG